METVNALITICITHYEDTDFILNTLYCLKKLTKNNYKVIIRDNNSKIHSYRKLKLGIRNYRNVRLYKVENFNLKGSFAHGHALNDLVSRIDTPYGVILDADSTFLIKDWDDILISKIDNKVKVIGTEAIGNEPKDFPSIVAVLFETETFKKMNIDFRARDISKNEDVAYEMPIKYKAAGFQGRNINVKNTRVFKEGPFKDVICAEYYLETYKNIFASHFGRGSTSGAHKYIKGCGISYRLPIIGRYLRVCKGRREKNKWIKTCRGVVDRQA